MVLRKTRRRSEIGCIALWTQLEFQRAPRTFGFHIFRRTAGTLVNERFHDLKLVQGTLGHSTIAVTAAVYVQQREGEIARATEFLTEGICDPAVTQEAAIAS